MSKIKNFTKQALAFMAGDTDGVIAAQNFRICSAALESQIAVLKGKAVNQEIVLGDKQELLMKAKYPAEKVQDGQRYIASLVAAEEAVEAAQENLDTTTHSIETYQAYLTEFNQDVDAPEEA